MRLFKVQDIDKVVHVMRSLERAGLYGTACVKPVDLLPDSPDWLDDLSIGCPECRTFVVDWLLGRGVSRDARQLVQGDVERRYHSVGVFPPYLMPGEERMDPGEWKGGPVMGDDPIPDVRRRCRVCLQAVRVYRPTGTRAERAVQHHIPRPLDGGIEDICNGSFEPTDDLTHGAREDAATRRWLAGQGISLPRYIALKGER